MNKELLKIISLYQSAIADLFPRLAKHLKIKLPISNIDWANMDTEQRGETPCGIQYFIHGYGVAMKNKNTAVDFDLGNNGQINGVDPFRLWEFINSSKNNTKYQSPKEIEKDIKQAVKNGDMIYSGYILYYLKNDL